jgi:hypothetical protein
LASRPIAPPMPMLRWVPIFATWAAVGPAAAAAPQTTNVRSARQAPRHSAGR